MNMKVDIDELSPVQRKVHVELPAETVAGEFSRAYKNLGLRVRVRGFRTGKIPRTVFKEFTVMKSKAKSDRTWSKNRLRRS